MWRRATVFFVVAVTVVVVLYDVAAVLMGGVDATVSRVLLTESGRHPWIPFLFGVLCGHLFFPQRVKHANER